MATVVDSLVVLLNLDPKNFTEGQKKALADLKKTRDDATTTAKELEARGKQGAEFFNMLKTGALRFLTIATGVEFIKWIGHVEMGIAATGRLASNLGMATSDMTAFGNMIERNGGKAEEAAQSFGALSAALQEYHYTGQMAPGMMEALGRIGATGGETPAELYAKFNVWAQGQSPQMVTRIGHGMGLTEGAINAARKSVVEFNAELEKSRRIGLLDEHDIKNAKEFEQAWVGLGQAWEHTGNTLTNILAPAMRSVMAAMTEMAIRDKEALEYFFGRGDEPAGNRSSSGKIRGAGAGAPSDLLGLVRKLENSADDAVSPAGAVGRYQIMPKTARDYGFDPARLKDPVYNEMVATAILSDLSRTYHGNTDQILSHYNASTKGNARYMATGDVSTLPRETQNYLARAHSMMSSGRGSSTSETNIGTIVVNTRATDADGIARDIATRLQENNRNLAIATQANSGMQ